MIRRPAGAPIIDYLARGKWQRALLESGTTVTDLAGRFAPAIAQELMRFNGVGEALFLVRPSLAGHSALAAARLLHAAGHHVRIAVEPEWRAADGEHAFRADLDRWDRPIESFGDAAPAPIVVDALFPTHWEAWRDTVWLARWRGLLRAASVTVAIDAPLSVSLNGHSSTIVDDHPIYTATIALGALRDQHVVMPTMQHCGRVFLASADPPIDSKYRVLGRPVIDPPGLGDQKYSRGMVVVVGGEMPGAARLAARAAASAGAGYVVLAGGDADAGIDAIVHRRLDGAGDLDILLDDRRIGAVVIGPGLGRSDDARDLLQAALESERRLVVDADALTLIGQKRHLLQRKVETWITPHLGEWTSIADDPIDEFGKFFTPVWWGEEGLGIICKGADTVIGTPEGGGVLDRPAPTWLSTAGTGDVLAGTLAARMATRCGDWRCGHEAAWLHLRAAELAGPAFTADRLIDFLPAAIGECR